MEIRVDLLDRIGVRHGFGTRTSSEPSGLLRPRQVHGVAVWRDPLPGEDPAEADAVVCDRPGVAIGVVTADCVPVLVATEDGSAVAAIHAGWRGLAEGVVEAGISALRDLAGSKLGLAAAVGPRIGLCCYEVDSPVLERLGARFGGRSLDAASIPTRADHARIDLARLVIEEIEGLGVARSSIAEVENPCTYCDVERFHSYRRDLEHAGRLIHVIAARGSCA